MAAHEQIQSRKLEDIRLILKDLLKVIKIVSLYPESNPLPQSLRRTFAERLVDLVADYGDFDFKISANKLYFNDETVFTDKSHEESLAGLFFESGITRLTFKSGLDVNEVYRLLDTIKAYQGADRRTRDLVAGLWETGLRLITYESVEDVALRQFDGNSFVQELDGQAVVGFGQEKSSDGRDYAEIFSQSDGDFPNTDGGIEVSFLEDSEAGSSSSAGLFSTGNEEADQALQIGAAVEAMGVGDVSSAPRPSLDTKLILSDEHKLSEEEAEHVAELVRSDAEFAEHESTCEMVKELLHQEPEMSDFYETVAIADRVLTEFVKIGRLTYASELLRYFAHLQDQLREDRPLWAERLRETRVAAGSRERIGVLCRALNDNQQIGSLELRRYLDNFEWEALMAIAELLGGLNHVHHRDAVKDYLVFRGKDRLHIVAKGLTDRHPEVVAASVNILATIGGEDALHHLGKVVHHRDAEVRRILVDTLADCPQDCCVAMLRNLAEDDDESIRQTAVRALVRRRGQPAFDALTDIINGARFAALGHADKKTVLTAYSRLGGDAAVDYLLELAQKPNLFRNPSRAFYREAAFEALAHNRGEMAERALVRMAGSWRPDIKTRARAALHQRRELIYGGTDE
ncbi:MAG: HEAT repeat domain-containing protein [Candidatus Zixiibacteriota bacterium]